MGSIKKRIRSPRRDFCSSVLLQYVTCRDTRRLAMYASSGTPPRPCYGLYLARPTLSTGGYVKSR